MSTVVQLRAGATEADIQLTLNNLPDDARLVLPAAQVINVTSGLVARLGARNIEIDLNGSTLKQAGNVAVIEALGGQAKAQPATLGETSSGAVTIKYYGAEKVTSGSWVKLFSDSALPQDRLDGGVPTRLGQAMQVAAVNGNTLTLAGQLLYQDAYVQNVRASAYSGGSIVIRNGTVMGDSGHPEWTANLVQVRSTVSSVIDHVTVRDGGSMGINVVNSVNTSVANVAVMNLINDPAGGHYGYGVHSQSSVGTTVTGLYAENVRHATDSNAIGVTAGNSDPSKYGADIGMSVRDAVAYNTTDFAYSWHSESRQSEYKDVMAFDSHGLLVARGVDNTIADSAGVGNARGILLYEDGEGDAQGITVDGVFSTGTSKYAYFYIGDAQNNFIADSYFQTDAVGTKIGVAADLLNTTLVVGVVAQDEQIYGSAGGDRLLGGKGVDTISGGGGDDYLWGGVGRDTLTGGAGRDRFAFHSVAEGGDVVKDFQVGQDVLDFSVMAARYGWKGDLLQRGYVQFSNVNGSTVVSVDTNGGRDSLVPLVTLQGVSPTALTVSDVLVELSSSRWSSSYSAVAHALPTVSSSTSSMLSPSEMSPSGASDLFRFDQFGAAGDFGAAKWDVMPIPPIGQGASLEFNIAPPADFSHAMTLLGVGADAYHPFA